MPTELNIRTVRDNMPVRYRYNPVSKGISVLTHFLISGYCLYVLVVHVTAQSAWWMKYLPLVVLFVSLDSLVRHVTTLNSVIFTPECVWFRYILKPPNPIEYDRLISLELKKVITYYVFVVFTDRKGAKRIIKVPASFPKMIEILYNIADLSPQIIMNEELDKMIGVIRNLKARQEQAAE